MNKFFIILLSIVISSCTLVSRKDLATPEKLELNKVKEDRKSFGHEQRLLTFAEKHPNTTSASEAYFELGNIAFKKKNFGLAIQYYDKVKHTKLSTKAKVLKAYSLVNLKRDNQAYMIADALSRQKRLDEETLYNILSIKALLSEDFENPRERLMTYDKLLYMSDKVGSKYNYYPETTGNLNFTSDPLKYRIKAIQIIDNLDVANLEKVTLSSDPLNAYLFYRLGKFYFEKSKFDHAKLYLERVTRLDRGRYRERASRLISQLFAKSKVNRKKVGVILPISGIQETYGHRALLGLNAAFKTYESNNDNDLELIVMDSQNNESVAERAVETLVIDHHVVAILGGLSSRTAKVISTKAQELGVVNITLSQKDGISDIGDYIFRNAMTLGDQIDYLVRTAIDKYKVKNFGMLYPKTKYGEDSSLIFWQTVLKYGGSVVAAQSYETDETDFSEHIKKLVGTYYVIDRRKEYKSKLDEWKSKNPHMSDRVRPPQNLLQPVVTFEALFIPDDVKALGQIAPMLSYNDVDEVTLLGTNLWNTPALRRRVPSQTNLIYVDSFRSESPPFSTSSFKRSFLKTFNSEPSIIELQSYDAGIFLKLALKKLKTNSRQKLKDIMLAQNRVPGALGPLEVQKNTGVIKRPLVLLERIVSKEDDQ